MQVSSREGASRLAGQAGPLTPAYLNANLSNWDEEVMGGKAPDKSVFLLIGSSR